MGDIDISREAVSKEIAALQKCEADPRCYYQFEETRALLGALRAALDAVEARAVGVRELVWENSVNGRWIGTPPVKLGDLAFWVFQSESGYYRFVTGQGRVSYATLERAQAAAQADYTARILSALHPASPLGAVVMREKAAQEILTAGDSTVTEALGQRLCCNGHHCGCQGSTVEQFLVHNIRALPLPTDDELLAAAAELPVVKALVVACKVADQVSRDLGWHRIYDVTGPALAPFTRKGE